MFFFDNFSIGDGTGVTMEKSDGLLYIQPAGTLNKVKLFSGRSKLLTSPDYTAIRDNFTKELQLASTGKQSSISYLRHYIPHKPLILSGLMQGIVIGGTHYEIITQNLYPDGKIKTLRKKRGRTPILKDCNVLSKFLQEHIHPDALAIGLSMAFPLKPLVGTHGEMDGIVEYGTKEHALKGLKGKPLGSWIKKKFKRDIPVAVANDVICLTLLSKGHEVGGFIAATGINMGMKENNKTAVNLESGNFNGFEADAILEKIDTMSLNRGKNRFEKEAAGKYLPFQFNAMAEYLNLKGLIPEVLKTEELSEMAESSKTGVANELAREILEHSASLVASQIAGLYEFRGRPENWD